MSEIRKSRCVLLVRRSHIVFTDMSVNRYYNSTHPVLIVNFPFSLLSLRTSSRTICSSSFSHSFFLSRFFFFSGFYVQCHVSFFGLTLPLYIFFPQISQPSCISVILTFSLGSLSFLPFSLSPYASLSSFPLDHTYCSSH